ncbi:hypothetical protein [Mycolicibacterium psychrotolerans]|uniref:Uncharacterized protein n=1 Tax=Mycolicibacterium psychrotolerans TaxID=216929 RepID=A0A7I7M7J1_9MYCO|nr:hypothetical protein [Mycolicibacterium psychrotolerans]BBX67827.1 hypothetical protein MPSYJ_12880 [Mycolicibacterium psychrotolerans]
MAAADGAAVASAVIAFLSMVGAGAGWLLARKEKDAAAEHERRAVEAAESAASAEKRSADAAERSAAAVEAQERRAAEQEDAAEADPWIFQPIPGDPDVYLFNRSRSPKYGVTAAGFKVHNSSQKWQVIGPGKRVELGVLRVMHPDDEVVITWHQREDRSDTPRSATEVIPSRT